MKEKDKIGVILINGAGLGSFIWKDLEPLINYPTLAIDFPNREKGDKANQKITFDNYLKSAINQIEEWNKEKIIIVAHSIGGCLGLRLCDFFGNKVDGLIAISSAIPKSGKSFASCLPYPQKILLPILLNLFGTKPPEKSIQSELCNDLSSAKGSEIVNRFTPESKLLYTTKINYNSLPNRRLYLKLTNDKAFPIMIQNKMADNLNAQNIVELESGHLPMISKPKELAEIINKFVKNG